MIESPNRSPASDSHPTGVLKKMKTGRGRVKNKQTSLDLESSYERIYIWDLDETLIILNTLLNGTFAVNHNNHNTININKKVR